MEWSPATATATGRQILGDGKLFCSNLTTNFHSSRRPDRAEYGLSVCLSVCLLSLPASLRARKLRLWQHTTSHHIQNTKEFRNCKIGSTVLAMRSGVLAIGLIYKGVVLTTVSTHCHCTVTTSWWASSLLREYTEDKSPQQELDEGPRRNSED